MVKEEHRDVRSSVRTRRLRSNTTFISERKERQQCLERLCLLPKTVLTNNIYCDQLHQNARENMTVKRQSFKQSKYLHYCVPLLWSNNVIHFLGDFCLSKNRVNTLISVYCRSPLTL